MESDFRTENQTRDLCYYYERKHGTRKLRPFPIWEEEENWFEIQLHVAKYLGVHWHDLYRKGINLNNLFREAAKRG